MSENQTSTAQPVCLPMALLCLAALASACGSDPLAAPTPHSYPIPGCETLDVTPCDTQKRDCQVSRFQLAACLRGTQAGTLPLVTVMTEQAYVDYTNGLYEGRELVGTNHFELAMVWLGLAQPGSFSFVPITKESIANWFGTYRWRGKDLLLIDHGKPTDDEASNVALVAAWIRALRDRDINIGVWTTVVSVFDVDSNWGADAMYFGEARFYSNRYKASLDGIPPADEFAQINASIRDDIAWIRAQPSPYVATNDRFAHNFGARAAYLAWQSSGADAVNALYDSKLITHQLMAGETQVGPEPTLRYHARPFAPSHWDSNATVTALGAWGLFLSLSRNLEPDAAWSLALNWSGEQLFVYKGAEPNQDDTALIWQLEMADEASASTLEEALRSGDPSVQVGRTGSFVTLAKASNGDSLDWAFVAD
ncbi:MAG: hypothetical protein WDO74_27645 [Pseudomonadota bacterium]